LKLSKIVKKIEEAFPNSWQESWDNSGLLAGDPWADVQRIMLALDPSRPVIEEAISKGTELLITHHPPDIQAPKQIVKGNTHSEALFTTIKNNIALYALHTPWDVSSVSPSFALASQIKLLDAKVLAPTDQGKFCKLVVFTPKDFRDQIREAITQKGAGSIGNYSDCTFSSEGQGTFLPGHNSNPFSGKKGELKREKEVRIETIVPKEILGDVINSMVKSHPYEEVAYDIYPLENTPGRIGFGTIGDLPRPMTLIDLVSSLKTILPTAHISVCGNRQKRISRVAILCGAGGDFYRQAIAQKADVLITGEAKYHTLRYAESDDFPIIVAGHFATEWIGLLSLKNELDKLIWDRPGEGVIEIASNEHGPMWSI